MLVGALLLIAGLAQHQATATDPAHERLAERFVTAAWSEPTPSMDADPDFMADELIRANPGRETEARRISREMTECMRRDGNAAMRRAAIEAALAFDSRQLERLITFVETQAAQLREGAPNRVRPDWEAARQSYGRWMYSIARQPSAVALARRCSDEMAASMAAAGTRD